MASNPDCCPPSSDVPGTAGSGGAPAQRPRGTSGVATTNNFTQRSCEAAAQLCNLDSAEGVVLNAIVTQSAAPYVVLNLLDNASELLPMTRVNTLNFWRLLSDLPVDARSQEEVIFSCERLVRALRLIESTRGVDTSKTICSF